MKKRKPITWKHYAFCGGAAVVVLVLVLCLKGVFTGSVTTRRDLFRILSDAFLAPGVLLVCTGGAILFYQLGAFDSLTYVAKQFRDAMIRDRRRSAHVQTFAEHVEARDAAPRLPCRHFLIVGGVCLALSALFMVLTISLP